MLKLIFKTLFLLSFLISNQLQARITNQDIIAILKNPNFKLHEKLSNLSPLLGAIGLDSGLIFNYRFYGPYRPKIEEGRRNFYFDGRDTADDKQDPLWLLAKIIFPSSQGDGLSTIVAADPANLARYLQEEAKKGAQVLGLLLAWTQYLRGLDVAFGIEELPSVPKPQKQAPVDIFETWDRSSCGSCRSSPDQS